MKKLYLKILTIFDFINNSLFINKISKIFKNNNEINLLDIGSSYDIDPRWKKMKKFINFFGFEPNQDLANLFKTRNRDIKNCIIFPFIADKISLDKKIINICDNPGVSSVLNPNREYLDLFQNSERFNIKRIMSIRSASVDSLNIENIDFIKIDTQGSEFEILQGCENTLDRTLGLEIEVEFQEMYQNQKLFGNIQEFLSKKKLYFCDFVYLKRWERHKYSGYGQCVFANALFLRQPEYINKNENDKKKILNYLIICLLYNKFDYCKCINLEKNFNVEEIKKIKKIYNFFKRKNAICRFISSVATGASRLFGNEYKSHLLN